MRTAKRTASLMAILSIGLAAGCVTTPVAEAPTTESARSGTITLEGYPLDRSLEGLTEYRDLDFAVVVSGPRLGVARWTTDDGKPPAYIEEGRSATMDEAAVFVSIVTPVTAIVEEVLMGGMRSGARITFDVAGGRVGSSAVMTSADVAPDLTELTKADRLLIAGPMVAGVLVPAFFYRLEEGGFSSLLSSVNAKDTGFSIDELRARLNTDRPPTPHLEVSPVPETSPATGG